MGRLINNRFGLRHMGSVGASPQTPYMDAANGAVNGAGRKLETLGGNKSGPRRAVGHNLPRTTQLPSWSSQKPRPKL